MPGKPVVIKKYENRRLYDTANSRYVNLEDVAGMVRDGAEVRVVDAATGEDITRVVLTQIIVENAKAPDSAFPLDVLRQMVMATGDIAQKGMLQYSNALLHLYRNFVPPVNPLDLTQLLSGGPRAPGPSGEVEELRRRIDELEQLVARQSGPTRPKRRRKPSPRR